MKDSKIQVNGAYIMGNITTFSYTRRELSLMPRRPSESHKGTFGRVLCVCGSRGMAGAAYFSGKAALRCGAGLVEILTTEDNRTVIQTLLPEAVVSVYDADAPDVELIKAAVSRADAVVCGCGLGVSDSSLTVLGTVLRTSDVPTVLDADALNLLSRNPSLLKYVAGRIITPHVMEMARLTGKSADEITADRNALCREYAQKHGVICVLKGHRTAVSDGGDRIYINMSGNSGMATGGSGDVLAGIIVGILAQSREGQLTAMQVACLGVYIHGVCGDVAAQKLGEYSLIASDIVDALPEILKDTHKYDVIR